MKGTKDNLSDSFLISEFLKGDDNAFSSIVDKYQKRVYYLVLRFLKNEEVAQDITQETFIKLYQNLRAFKGKSNLYTYIYRIAINNCKNYYYKETKSNPVFIYSLPQSEMASAYSPFKTLKTKEDILRVSEIIDKLPYKQKTTFMLRIFEDLSFKEIAEVMGFSINSALVNYHIAVKKIIKEWGKIQK